jgi:hypothetical protein
MENRLEKFDKIKKVTWSARSLPAAATLKTKLWRLSFRLLIEIRSKLATAAADERNHRRSTTQPTYKVVYV